jgi:hypothetical protein
LFLQGVKKKLRYQTLRGATGTGKTFVMANVINATQLPTLVLAPNKMLAAQLCTELKEFFPANKIEYFVSYYDYYRPEAYLAVSDVFVEKVSVVNDDIDRLRHSATRSLFERPDTVIVSSVSCIYGLGMPAEYLKHAVRLYIGKECSPSAVACRLQEIHYTSNDDGDELKRGQFLLKHHNHTHTHVHTTSTASSNLHATLEIGPAHTEDIYELYFYLLPQKFGDMTEETVANLSKDSAARDTNTPRSGDRASVKEGEKYEGRGVEALCAEVLQLRMYIGNMTVRQRGTAQAATLNSTAAVAVAAANIATGARNDRLMRSPV